MVTPTDLSVAIARGLEHQAVRVEAAQRQAEADVIKSASLVIDHVHRVLSSRVSELAAGLIQPTYKFSVAIPDRLVGTSAKRSCEIAVKQLQEEGFDVKYAKSSEMYDNDTHTFYFSIPLIC